MKRIALSEWINVDRRVARSVNLERDARDKNLLERFQVTPVACDVLRRLADALEGERTNAWSLTGPYGTGKSAFCNFLMALSIGVKEERRTCYEKIKQADAELAERLKKLIPEEKSKPPVIGVRAVSQYESLNSTLARGLAHSVKEVHGWGRNKKWKELLNRIEQVSSQDWPNTREVVKAYKDLTVITGKPVFIVVDEFGKNLEFQAHHSDQGDIFILQALAESEFTFLWVCLHQAFQTYAGALSQVQREEWQKIQGRFEDYPYVEPPIRSFNLIRDALSVNPPDEEHEEVLNHWAQGMADAMSGIRLNGLGALNPEAIKSLYPFHPLSVYLLGEMTRRFGQNDRTLFSFLSSGEAHAFSNCLRNLDTSQDRRLPTLGVDKLYDYFTQTGALRNNADRSENQRWIEIQSIIASHGALDWEKIRVLKTVGVLNLLSTMPWLTASDEIIHAALATSFYKTKKDTKKALLELTEKGILLYRRYANEYRLWEGSDFDIDFEVTQARGRVALRSISEMLEEVAHRPNLIASRHSVQKGTLREFRTRWATEDDIAVLMQRPHEPGKGDGTLWLIVGRQKTPKGITDIAKEGDPVVVGYAPCLEQVRDLLFEASATSTVCNAPQLERDGVARKEARHRAAQATEALSKYLMETFSPGLGSVKWFASGKLQNIASLKELSTLISDLCDSTYNLCPPINNEMINVDRLTSQATAARNRVVEALANNAVQEDLGFEGYGPEVAVYRTLIKNTGLHRQDKGNLWSLHAPDKREQPELFAVWELFDQLLLKSGAEERAIPVKEILNAVKKPPFGLREGPAPLLLCHYLLVRSDEIAVYEDGIFKPFFGDAEATLLMRRPKLFSLRLYQTTGIKSEVIRTYFQVVNTGLELVEGARNQTILSIVVPLTQFLDNLPEYTQTTRSLNPNTLRLRNAIAHMQDPQNLLFQDIPEALGFEIASSDGQSGDADYDANALRESLWESLIELRDAYDRFVRKVKARFKMVMAEPTEKEAPFDALRHDLNAMATSLVNACMDTDLRPVLGALADESGSDEQWLSQVAAVILKKPLTSWRDGDIEPFALRLGEIRERINQLNDLKRIAERKGNATGKSYMIGIQTPAGGMAHKKLDIPKNPDDLNKSVVDEFIHADKERRTAWLFLLIQTMMEQGDFS